MYNYKYSVEKFVNCLITYHNYFIYSYEPYRQLNMRNCTGMKAIIIGVECTDACRQKCIYTQMYMYTHRDTDACMDGCTHIISQVHDDCEDAFHFRFRPWG